MDTNHTDTDAEPAPWTEYEDYDAEYYAAVREERLEEQEAQDKADRLVNEEWVRTEGDRAKAEAAAYAELMAIEIPF